MNAPEKFKDAGLPDVQAQRDTRALAIQKAGVRGIRYPIIIDTGEKSYPSVGLFDMTVGLDASTKGTHMSRFIEVLEDNTNQISYKSVLELSEAMLARLEAESGYIKIKFPFFMEKRAPVSKVHGIMDYQVTYEVYCYKNAPTNVWLEVVVPVTSLCPCSKNISEYGAHNQRSHITIKVLVESAEVEVQDIIKIAEKSASCELWSILKRPDEKFVTERAFNNPKFVEDLVRDVAIEMQRLTRKKVVGGFSVESENFESIHNHSAFARIEHNT
tara:strand:+ start:133 stop:948 length:816 start_codon:yes stop_codon:yes gene_type:complete